MIQCEERAGILEADYVEQHGPKLEGDLSVDARIVPGACDVAIQLSRWKDDLSILGTLARKADMFLSLNAPHEADGICGAHVRSLPSTARYGEGVELATLLVGEAALPGDA